MRLRPEAVPLPERLPILCSLAPIFSNRPTMRACACVRAIAVNFLRRPENITAAGRGGGGGGQGQPRTSVVCAWAEPRAGDRFDVSNPLSKTARMKNKGDTTGREGNSASRRVLKVAEEWSQLVGLSDMETPCYSQSHLIRVAKRYELCRAVRTAQGSMGLSAFCRHSSSLHCPPALHASLQAIACLRVQ